MLLCSLKTPGVPHQDQPLQCPSNPTTSSASPMPVAHSNIRISDALDKWEQVARPARCFWKALTYRSARSGCDYRLKPHTSHVAMTILDSQKAQEKTREKRCLRREKRAGTGHALDTFRKESEFREYDRMISTQSARTNISRGKTILQWIGRSDCTSGHLMLRSIRSLHLPLQPA